MRGGALPWVPRVLADSSLPWDGSTQGGGGVPWGEGAGDQRLGRRPWGAGTWGGGCKFHWRSWRPFGWARRTIRRWRGGPVGKVGSLSWLDRLTKLRVTSECKTSSGFSTDWSPGRLWLAWGHVQWLLTRRARPGSPRPADLRVGCAWSLLPPALRSRPPLPSAAASRPPSVSFSQACGDSREEAISQDPFLRNLLSSTFWNSVYLFHNCLGDKPWKKK